MPARSLPLLIARLLARLRAWTGARYRPEEHYMRGPGPKTRARQRNAGAARS